VSVDRTAKKENEMDSKPESEAMFGSMLESRLLLLKKKKKLFLMDIT
jgi:hypothetical protein